MASRSRMARYVSRFSSAPSMISTSMPVRMRTRSTKMSALAASRTALVATVRRHDRAVAVHDSPKPEQRADRRHPSSRRRCGPSRTCRARSAARVTPVPGSPAAARGRCWRSTRRIAEAPMSMTATGPKRSGGAVAGGVPGAVGSGECDMGRGAAAHAASAILRDRRAGGVSPRQRIRCGSVTSRCNGISGRRRPESGSLHARLLSRVPASRRNFARLKARPRRPHHHRTPASLHRFLEQHGERITPLCAARPHGLARRGSTPRCCAREWQRRSCAARPPAPASCGGAAGCSDAYVDELRVPTRRVGVAPRRNRLALRSGSWPPSSTPAIEYTPTAASTSPTV